MCGVAGIAFFDEQEFCGEPRIRRMCDAIHHRGPDDAGVYLDRNVGLGHQRLSIIDLASGHQPMLSENGRLVIVFNGEIYNYRGLRDELIRKGYAFRTESDTEVILNLFREHGEECVRKMNGMFAFAIWDTQRRRLFLARDHMGIKPMYFARTGKCFVFASEIKALFESGEVVPAENREVVPEYFLFRYVAGRETLFRDVFSLLPGHSLTLDGSRVEIRQYWSPEVGMAPQRITMADAAVEVERTLRDAVERQMVSDVPLGTFCSGGIDSSLITAVAAQYAGDRLNTFSVGFHERDFDETEYALQVARRYGTDHHEIRVDHQEFDKLLPRMVWQNDEPLNFGNAVQIYAVSTLAKRYVTVVLTGEGADELFGGYPRYYVPRLARIADKARFAVRPLLDLLVRASGDHRLARVRAFLGQTKERLSIFNAATLPEEFLIRTGVDYRNIRLPYRTEMQGAIAERESDPVAQTCALDLHTYLVSILNRQDKMSMAASIEARVPYLDVNLVGVANRLPMSLRLSWRGRKRVIKEVARKYLPRDVVERRKSGFGVPIAEWMRSDSGLGARVCALSNNPRLVEMFGYEPLARLIGEHRAGMADHSEFLWPAVNYMLWREQFRLAD